MRVRSDRRHRFAVTPEELWGAVSDVDRYTIWWPWLREFEAEGLIEGDEWTCVVQPPLPYTVRFTILIEDVVPELLVGASVHGDIEGEASVSFRHLDGSRTEARLVADLAPAHAVLKTVGLLAGPVVRIAHNWILDTGARQFRERVIEGGD